MSLLNFHMHGSGFLGGMQRCQVFPDGGLNGHPVRSEASLFRFVHHIAQLRRNFACAVQLFRRKYQGLHGSFRKLLLLCGGLDPGAAV